MRRSLYYLVGLIVVILSAQIVATASDGSYDPWMDLNDDGIIDVQELQLLALIYGASGTPINKTALLLELEARINSLNTTLLTEYYNITECEVVFVDASGDIITGYLDVDSGTLYIDDINDRVGIGTTSPDTRLYVTENASLKYVAKFIQDNPEGYGIRIKTSGSGTNTALLIWDGSNHLFRVQQDGNVGIGTKSPTAKLDVTGNTTIRGTLNASSVAIPTTTRYYTIPGSAWQPKDSTYTFYKAGVYTYTTTPGTTEWYAPVNLPHRAVITQFMAWAYDNTGQNISVYLFSQSGGSGNPMALITSNSSWPSYAGYTDNSIDYATVDNQNYAYYVYGILRSGDDNHRLSQVRITYTITEPLP